MCSAAAAGLLLSFISGCARGEVLDIPDAAPTTATSATVDPVVPVVPDAPSTGTPVTNETQPSADSPVLKPTGDLPTSARVSTEFGPLSVILLDAAGQPVPDAPVTFSVPNGGATFPERVFVGTTGVDGVVTAYGLRASKNPGPVSVQVASGDVGTTISLQVIR